jgi:dipeptidyl aminopeptidase/acylaminoacyl peptidase
MSSIPRELLFGNPERASPKISPDGKRLAWLAPDEGVLNVWCDGKPLTKDRGRGIRVYFWAEDQRSLLYMQDKDGDENWHLYAVDVNTGEVRDLTQYPEVMAQVVATHPKFPHEVLVALNVRDKRLHDVYRLDLRDGSAKLEMENPGDVVGWLADQKHQVRAARAMTPDGGTELRLLDGGKWKTFFSWGPDDQGGAHGFTPDNEGLYVESSHDSDTTSLWLMPLSGGRAKKLAGDPGSDLAGVMHHPRDFRVQAVGFDRQRLKWTALDPEIAPDLKALSELADGDFHVVSRDDADETWIVAYNMDKRPPSFWKYSRKKKKGEFLFSTRPALDKHALSPMEPVEIPASDGLKLPAYLTRADKNPKPLVLLVHGGPWARDHWGFHPEAQWLASRGYAVLQINYRSSTGFGKAHLHAGDKQWGKRMQDDLTEAVDWAVKTGAALLGRAAIYGGSYGGYAALAGAAFTPKTYRCAVDIVGPSNLVTLIKSIPPYWEPMKRIFDLRVGSVETEEAMLKERSPLFSADKIEIPLLIAQGANDPRVKQAESEMIVEALRAKGKPVEYMLFPDEGHGFARPENRLKFYAAAEAFLAKHLA